MTKSVAFEKVKGQISAPPSKSAAQRALAISLIKSTETELFNVKGSEDILNALEVIKSLGAAVLNNNDSIKVTGWLNPVSSKINTGESGLAVRMFSPIVALLSTEIELSGKGSLLSRPINMIENPLRQLGVDVRSADGYLPVRICGPVIRKTVEIDGSVSSQFLTGMLIAQGENTGGFTINVSNLKSRPYVDLTIKMMKQFGVEVINTDYEKFFIAAGQKYTGNYYTVEGDWSGASFFISAAACGGDITIKNLLSGSAQADIAMLDAVKMAGGIVSFSDDGLSVTKGRLVPFVFDATECPDLFPPLVSLACNIRGKTVISGVHRLKHKESDRGSVLKKEFAKLGIDITVDDDKMIITGGTLKSGTIDSNNDHRIAMAAAAAAAGGGVKIEITGAEAVNKSYSSFYADLVSAGGTIE